MKTYTKKAKSIAQYAKMRGVTDFSNAEQFNIYESGYQHIFVISTPKFIDMLGQIDSDVKDMLDTFVHIIEYEFKNLDGIEDITTDGLEITYGISTLQVMGRVTKQSATEVSMSFTEKSGAAITNFLKYMIEGIRDPRTQDKTYHGLIKWGKLAPGFENEVFDLLYVVTDNTGLMVERAYLLCNAWPTKASTSIYNGEKGSIDKKDIDVSWQCFVIDGPDVDAAAVKALSFYSEKGAVEGAYVSQDGNNNRIAGIINNIGSVEEDLRIHTQYDGSAHVIPTDAPVETDSNPFTHTKTAADSALYTYAENGGVPTNNVTVNTNQSGKSPTRGNA